MKLCWEAIEGCSRIMCEGSPYSLVVEIQKREQLSVKGDKVTKCFVTL